MIRYRPVARINVDSTDGRRLTEVRWRNPVPVYAGTSTRAETALPRRKPTSPPRDPETLVGSADLLHLGDTLYLLIDSDTEPPGFPTIAIDPDRTGSMDGDVFVMSGQVLAVYFGDDRAPWEWDT